MALGNLQEIIPAMFTGANGERLTPEQIAQRQQVAQSLLARASDTRPDAGGWASVLTKGLLGYQAGRDQRQSDEAIKTNAAASEANVGSMLGSLGLTGGNAFPATPAAVAPSMGVTPMAASPLQTTPLPEGQEWLQYANQGAIRNQPINEKLTSALSFLPELGVTMKVVSGGETAERKASNSGRHMHGNAADVDFYLGDRKLTPKNEQDRSILSQIVQRGKTAGITGWGEGDDYMGSGRVHLGFGNAGVWGAKGKGANAPEWLVNAYNSKPVMSSPQAAIQAIAPIEQGDENPAAGMAPVAQTDGAYVDPLVSVQPQPQQNNFDARFAGVQPVAEALMPLDTGTVSSIPQPQPVVDDRLVRLNDQIFGGALAENGVGNPVAQALVGYFPEAPSANRSPIQQVMPQQPQQQQQEAPQMQAGGINPAIVQALSSPYASAQEKQIAGLLLNQQMQKQAQSQEQQIEMARRQQVAQATGIDPRFANDPDVWKAAVNQSFAKNDSSLINAGDGRLYNPNTQEWITAPNSGEPKFRKATPEEAASYGAVGGQIGSDGKFYPINPPSGTSLSVDPSTGAVTFNQGAGVKPLTEGQSKDTTYSTRAQGALPILDKFGSALTSATEAAKDYDPTGVVRGTQSAEFQQARQAGDEFLQAILRKDTGAAITTDEMNSYGRTYLPWPGDGVEVLEQKRVARTRALEAMKAGMPPQAIMMQEQALEKAQPANTSSSGNKTSTGVTWSVEQ